MGKRASSLIVLALGASFVVGSGPGLIAAAPAFGSGDSPSTGGSLLPFPALPQPFQHPKRGGRDAFGDGGDASANPGITSPLVPPRPKPQDQPAPKTRQAVLDALFDRLGHSDGAEEASGIAGMIQHVWLDSGSDTAELLMTRAMTASQKGNTELAIHLLDTVLVLDPDWAEGWNKRATLRFLNNDDAGSMEDISHVLALEPRHFGAMTGMASILLRYGMKKQALTLLRKAAAVYPHNADMQKLIDELVPAVEGRGI